MGPNRGIATSNVCMTIVCLQIASLLALILAWVYIFDTVMKERELLENPQEGIVGAIPRDVENPAAPAAQPQQNGRSGEWGFFRLTSCRSISPEV